MQLSDWVIKKFSVFNKNSFYNTSFGDPELNGKSEYSGILIEMIICRKHSITIFMKLVTGLHVAFFISLLIFKIKPQNSEN